MCVCIWPEFSFHILISRAKVIENLWSATILLRDFPLLVGLFIMKTQLTEVFIYKPHLLKLRNLMM